MGKKRENSDMDFGIRVGAVIPRRNAILLARHDKPQSDPYWVLPGGRLEPGESIPKCAIREVSEETGLTGHFSGVLHVSEFQKEGRHTIDITALIEVDPDEEAVLGSDPEVEDGAEPTLKELRWVELKELDGVELLPGFLIERLVSGLREGWSTGGIYLTASHD